MGNLARGKNCAATLADDGGHRLGDLRVIDDASGLDQETAQTTDTWLAAGYFGLVEPLDVEPVGAGSFVERLHAGEFRHLSRYQQLAALFEGDVTLAAELDRRLHPLAAELSFETSRLVIDAGVDDAAVAARLVACECGLLFQNRHRDPREPLRHLHRRRQSDDAPANHREIEISHSPPTPEPALYL
jgi:hypothetical protein